MDNNIIDTTEFDFIVDSLNSFWNNAIIKLQDKNLGDIEKSNYAYQKDKSMELMRRIMSRIDNNLFEYESLVKANKELLEALKELLSAGQEALDYKDGSGKSILQEVIWKYENLAK